jgi:translation initiation factor 4A
MISTDPVPAELDLQAISLVIHYDLPSRTLLDYLARTGLYLPTIAVFFLHFSRNCFISGRSGKYGRKGVSICFITRGEINYLREIEKYFNTSIEEMPMSVADLL